MRGGDHSLQVFEVHHVGTYRVRSWKGRIARLREMGDNGNERKFLKVMGLEGGKKELGFRPEIPH